MELVERASDSLDDHGRGYPRPLLRRATWYSLNGEWDFALDAGGVWEDPRAVEWIRTIRVPFAPETPASGIGDTSLYRACWYRCQVVLPTVAPGERLMLRFGAVDYRARVWIGDTWLGDHEGGYTPFAFDITACAGRTDACSIVVHAEDDPADLTKPRGKQDWQRDPHSIWYPRTSGIWQTVWIERVPRTSLARVTFTPHLSRWEIGIHAIIEGAPHEPLRLDVSLTCRGVRLATDVYSVIRGEVHRRIALSDPGIDDSRNELLWSPHAPTLIEVQLDLWGARDTLLDRVVSYTALRATGVQGDRFVLNNRPYFLRMVLDQGYWPDTGLTAPDDQALKRDVELARAMGFNGVRKHQKIEDPRYLYWADRLGLAVWEEMPSAYRFTRASVSRLVQEWMEVLQRDISHPCIVAWVPINESWGVPNLTEDPTERHYVQALYHLTSTLDATRPVVGNDGWESVATDIIGIHDYDDQPARIARRYRADEALPRLFKRERPGGRMLVLDPRQPHVDQPLMLTEFGGITFSSDPKAWGYARCSSADEFARCYHDLVAVVRELPVLSGFCYTQFADTYQEANGLLYADRTAKMPLAQIASVTSGQPARRLDGLEQLHSVDEP